MTHEFRNVSSTLLSICLNSGDYCHLAPGVAVTLESYETQDNAMVKKLVSRGVLTEEKAKAVRGKKSKKKTGAGKKKTARKTKKSSKKKARTSNKKTAKKTSKKKTG